MDGNGRQVCGAVVAVDGFGDIGKDGAGGVGEEGGELDIFGL